MSYEILVAKTLQPISSLERLSFESLVILRIEKNNYLAIGLLVQVFLYKGNLSTRPGFIENIILFVN